MRRVHRHHLGHKEDLNRWLISYADYMTLMFALFVVLYAVALVDEEKYQQIIDSFKEATEQFSKTSFEPPIMGILPFDTETIIEQDGTGLINPQDRATDGDTQLSLYNKRKLGASLTGLENTLNDSMVKLVESGQAKVNNDSEWVTIELSSGMIFPGGSATLTKYAKQLLKDLGVILKPVNNYVRVRGYTDNTPISNEIYPSNWELSAARANAVLRALEGEGLASPRLAMEAYGQYNPFSENTTLEGRNDNRKVVIALSKYAWVPVIDVWGEKNKAKVTPQKKADSDEILTVPLEGGGVRFTTRQE